MIMNIYNLLLNTNGDIAGVALFTLLIYYFVSRHINYGLDWFETGLLISSAIALVVDVTVSFKEINNLLYSKDKLAYLKTV